MSVRHETTPKPCTCHPDDNPPVPCAQQYALTDCRQTAQHSTADTVRLVQGQAGGCWLLIREVVLRGVGMEPHDKVEVVATTAGVLVRKVSADG